MARSKPETPDALALAASASSSFSAAPAQRGFAVGDEALYVPGEFHALDKGSSGEYPWELGWREQHPLQKEAKLEILAGQRIKEAFSRVQRSPNSAVERKKLVFIRPKELWPCTVRAVNDDGTVNLDIRSNKGGVTLHYDNVPTAGPDEPFAAHTCRPSANS